MAVAATMEEAAMARARVVEASEAAATMEAAASAAARAREAVAVGCAASSSPVQAAALATAADSAMTEPPSSFSMPMAGSQLIN
eukprot:CAMPEP_0115083880 /NCGR_PEP_ID=MMETSP0227-20121206/20876_1 /TAXON_ID=89957 /ORGANISM="Polarella glacialis, Strain CCMP 1383" /LENGTH=83 /DNA_ID=CAMNT_0002472477 /DNA_START=10 /DNA_END=261 /DNA_ORIENTATION=-